MPCLVLGADSIQLISVLSFALALALPPCWMVAVLRERKTAGIGWLFLLPMSALQRLMPQPAATER